MLCYVNLIALNNIGYFYVLFLRRAQIFHSEEQSEHKVKNTID